MYGRQNGMGKSRNPPMSTFEAYGSYMCASSTLGSESGVPPPKGAVWIWAGNYYNIFFTNLLLKCSISLYHACGQQTTVVLSLPDIL